MRGTIGFIKTTIRGGILFLLPVMVLLLVVGQLLQVFAKTLQAVLRLLPGTMLDSPFAQVVASLMALVLLAFLCGLLAQTGAGQRIIEWIRSSIIGTLPQFRVAEGLAARIDEGADDNVRVVLAPDGEGYSLGLVFDVGDGTTTSVFLPGAPDWKAGRVAFYPNAELAPAGIGMGEAIELMKRLGAKPGRVLKALPLKPGE